MCLHTLLHFYAAESLSAEGGQRHTSLAGPPNAFISLKLSQFSGLAQVAKTLDIAEC